MPARQEHGSHQQEDDARAEHTAGAPKTSGSSTWLLFHHRRAQPERLADATGRVRPCSSDITLGCPRQPSPSRNVQPASGQDRAEPRKLRKGSAGVEQREVSTCHSRKRARQRRHRHPDHERGDGETAEHSGRFGAEGRCAGARCTGIMTVCHVHVSRSAPRNGSRSRRFLARAGRTSGRGYGPVSSVHGATADGSVNEQLCAVGDRQHGERRECGAVSDEVG